jgi:hypothetical protein
VASSKSVIQVSIIGDAKKLIGAVGEADKATGGLVKSGAKVLAGGIAVKKGFDLIGDSLQEADRRGDAIQRLQRAIGDLNKPLVEASDNFAHIGASSQDILELEAAYADFATSAGIAAPDIAANAEELAKTALALAQVHDEDPSAILDAIGRAAGGATKSLKPYGVDVSEAAVVQRALAETGKDNAKALTDQEKAAARVSLILEAFKPIVDDVTTGTADLAQKQDELGAKFETTMGKIGAGVEGPLSDVLDFINDEIDAIPGAIEGWNMLGDAIVSAAQNALAPLARLNDLLNEISFNLNHINIVGDKFQTSPGRAPRNGGLSDAQIAAAQKRDRERNGLGR